MRSLRATWRHPIARNAMALYWVQFATFIVPLLTLPYVSRVLGDDEFGTVVFAQGFGFLLILILDFGFGTSATRAVAIHRGQPEEIERIVADVQGAKLSLVAAALLAALLAVLFIPNFQHHPGNAALATVAAVSAGMTPWWYFLGTESIRFGSVVQLASRFGSAALTFPLVRGQGQGWIVLALWAGSSFFVAAVLTVVMYRRVRLRRASRPGMASSLRESWILFIGTGAISLYTSANVVMLGLLSSNAQVAHFGAAERLVRAATQLIGPIIAVVFPRLAYLQGVSEHRRARRLALVTIAILGGIGVIGALLLIALAGVVIPIVFGHDFGASVGILRILALLIPFNALTAAIGGGWMLALRMDATLSRIIVTGGLLNVGLALLLAPAYGARGMAISVVLAEAVVLSGCLIAIWRRGGPAAEVTDVPDETAAA